MLTDPVNTNPTDQVPYKGFGIGISYDVITVFSIDWILPIDWEFRDVSTSLDCIHMTSSSPTGKRYAY